MARIRGRSRRRDCGRGLRSLSQKDSALYATLLGQPKTSTITLKAVSPKSGSQIFLFGNDQPLVWAQQGNDIKITLPAMLPGKYAYVFRMGV